MNNETRNKALSSIDGFIRILGDAMDCGLIEQTLMPSLVNELNSIKSLLQNEEEEKISVNWPDNKILTEEQKLELLATMDKSRFDELYCLEHEPEEVTKLTLKDFGYADGDYYVKCSDCKIMHIADKRAYRCKPCACGAYSKMCGNWPDNQNKEKKIMCENCIYYLTT